MTLTGQEAGISAYGQALLPFPASAPLRSLARPSLAAFLTSSQRSLRFDSRPRNIQKDDPEWDRPFELVEVAGIEPASENLSRKASTCLVYVLNLTRDSSHRQDMQRAILL